MKINDSVYGEQEIDNPVVVELINSAPMQRLKRINQHGTHDIGVTRFAHGIGVFLLLRKLGASFEEQIAGLLHDVNHTAFSHVIDYVYDAKNHDYTEQFHKQIILNSEIPAILKKAGIDASRVAEYDNFKLLERKMPDLCADRLDYTFRDTHAIGYITKEKAQSLADSLVVFENQIVAKDKESAKKIAELYLKMADTFWASPEVSSSFQFLANIMKRALELKVISEKDFFLTDSELLAKLKSAKDLKIQHDLKYKPEDFVQGTGQDYDMLVHTKARHIDPLFLDAGVLKRLSANDSDYKEKLNNFIAKINKGFFVKIKK